MFDLVIIISRFLFIFYIAYFLFEGVIYILDERAIYETSQKKSVAIQRVTIIFMHLTAFLIVSYIPGTYNFRLDTLIIGGISLIAIMVGHFALNKVYKNSCLLMWNCVFFLLDTGLIMLQRLNPDSAKRQLYWFGVGFVFLLLIPFVLKFIKKSEKLKYVFLITAFVLLISPLIIGVRTNGSLNWITIYGFNLQPSELVKFLFVFYLASVFRKRPNIVELIFQTGISFVFVCILVMQRDLGGALIFFMTYMVMLYISTGSITLFFTGILGASGASVLAYKVFYHIRVRVSAWLDPWKDISNTGYQITQSLFAIGTWGFLGRGLTRGIPLKIPVVESDFIYAAICEELGGFFGIGLIGIFMMIFYRGVHISLRCRKRYYSLLAAGFTSMLAFQTFLILGGVSKLVPLTGVTLPFISYGGSSIVVSIMMIGILEWIYMYNKDGEDDELEETDGI